jgi:hypothetical protein
MLKVIEHHSASSGNTFIDCPHMWIIDKLYKFESEPNARMVMGLAAEDAAHYGLLNQINDEDSITDYSVRKYLEHKGITGDEDECDWSGKIANTFIKELKQYGDIISYQKEADVPGDKYGLKFNIVAKTDFEFENFIVDTKATAKVWRYAATVSEKKQGKKGKINHNYHPKSDHLRQQFLYRELFGKECLLLYASPWDNHTSDLGDHVGYLEQLINAFKSIEHILNIANTKEDIVRMYPLTFDNWRWRYTPGAEEFARKIWSKAFK